MSEEALGQLEKPRRRQLDDDYTQTLLNSLTLDQIREAVYSLAPKKKISLRAHADSLDAVVATGRPLEVIQQTLLDVEQAYPFKHCLLLRLDFLGKVPAVDNVYKNGDFEFTLSCVNKEPVLSLTFEHSVEFKEWVEVEKDIRKRRTVVTRQPIVIRVHPKRKLLTLSYPGYTHSGAPGTSGYEGVVASLLQILLGEGFGWKFKTLPIRDVLTYLLDGANKRIVQVKADVDTPLARLDVSAKGKGGNIEEALAAFISTHLPGVDKDDLISASKKAFLNAVPNSIVLYWVQEKLFTRLRFWDSGTELHFVWNKESASYPLVDEITYTLSETSRIVDDGSSGAQQALAWISAQSPQAVVAPGDLALRFQLAPNEARSALLTAMKAGLVEPVYRVATNETLEDFSNDWSSDLEQFRRVLTTISGLKIEGFNPSNIEVAFRRVAFMKVQEQ